MSAITFFVVLALLVTIGILAAGGVAMARGGKFDEQHSAQLMEARVIVQGVAIALIAIAAIFWL